MDTRGQGVWLEVAVKASSFLDSIATGFPRTIIQENQGMKILQVISYFAPRWGGDVSVCYNLSRELAELGHEVTIITTDYNYDPDYAQSLENVEVIPFRRVANLGLFLYSPGMKRWLRSNISNYDLVHLHSFRSYQNNIVCKYAMEFDVPYIVQPHGSLPRIVEKKGLKQAL